MVDEFQDVSPQIVSWLRASLREIRSRGPAMHVGRGAQRSSLLCVGDDWQSIYGWRGSSPSYFMAFNKQFPSPTTTRVMLTDNYRSHQHIIDAAEHIVRAAAAIPGKKAKASGVSRSLSPVNVLDRDDEGLARRLDEHYRNGDSILMLYRKSSDKLLIEKYIQPTVNVDSSLPYDARRLRQMTYHSAKGLQADAVFLLGDCQHLSSSPYKNQVYRMAGLGQDGDAEPYDSAQRTKSCAWRMWASRVRCSTVTGTSMARTARRPMGPRPRIVLPRISPFSLTIAVFVKDKAWCVYPLQA